MINNHEFDIDHPRKKIEDLNTVLVINFPHTNCDK